MPPEGYPEGYGENPETYGEVPPEGYEGVPPEGYEGVPPEGFEGYGEYGTAEGGTGPT